MNRLLKILSVVCLMAFAAGVTFVIMCSEIEKKETPVNVTVYEESELSSKINEIARYINKYYVGDADEQEINDAISGAMISALGDRWSYYISADEWDAYLEQMNNVYVGIGVTILKLDDGGFEIENVTAGAPAEEAGLKAGDVIIGVNQESCLEWDVDTIKSVVKGEEGTTVQLTIRHADGTEEEVTVERRSVDTAVATSELLDGNIGLIRIVNFDANCADSVIACIEDLTAQGAEALIFDVRYNPGGMKTELVKLLDYLLPEGDLFNSVDYRGNEETDTSDAACLEMPMAVLVNGSSYSAAEFFAAALQEYDWAEIVGTQTCGKGRFQNTFQLSDGSAIAISTGTYYTPNGVSLTDVGITPDEVVELDGGEEEESALYYGSLDHEDDEQLLAAEAYLEEQLAS